MAAAASGVGGATRTPPELLRKRLQWRGWSWPEGGRNLWKESAWALLVYSSRKDGVDLATGESGHEGVLEGAGRRSGHGSPAV